MSYFLQNVHLLEDFTTRILVFDVHLINAFDSDILASEFLDA